MSAGDAYETAHLAAAFGTNKHAGFPATYYVALFTAAPTDAGGGTEVVGGAYARVGVANTDANWTVASGQAKNATAITFAEATAAWGTITHWALMSAATAGSVVHWNALGTSLAVTAGMTPYFAINALVITAD